MQNDITQLLHAWQAGDDEAKNVLFDAVYTTLRQMAQSRLGAGQAGATLMPTELLNEAIAGLLARDAKFESRSHFFAIAALKMRAVLVDYARAETAGKRGGGVPCMTLSRVDQDAGGNPLTDSYEVLALHQALLELRQLDSRVEKVVEMTYFGGMSREEIALVLDVSVPTVGRDLRFARAWLNSRLA